MFKGLKRGTWYYILCIYFLWDKKCVMGTQKLSEWLRPLRTLGRDKPVRIYMGNEAGDLDSGIWKIRTKKTENFDFGEYFTFVSLTRERQTPNLSFTELELRLS